MNKYEPLTTLCTIAQTYGKNPAIIQGGGGNVSIKTSNKEMLVKASGLRLDDLTPDHGFVPIDYETIRSYIETINTKQSPQSLIQENDAVVANATITSGMRPSIETGFHAVLGTAVIHTHAVIANLLNCSIEGKDIIKKIFPDALYIPYYTPGVTLTVAINRAHKETPAPLLFLENHGIITYGDTPTTAAYLHDTTLGAIETYFGISTPTITVAITPITDGVHTFPFTIDAAIYGSSSDFLKLIRNTILFPDQMVYTNHIDHNLHDDAPLCYGDESSLMTVYGTAGFAKAAAETLAAWMYIHETIAQLGLTHRTLHKSEGTFIANLDSEKYRKKIA